MLIFLIRRLLRELQPTKTAKIALVCYCCIVVPCLIVEKIRLGILITAACSLLFLLTGFIAFPGRMPEFEFNLPGQEGDGTEQDQAVSLSNLRIETSSFPQYFHGQMLVRNWALIATIWIVALVAMILVLSPISFEKLLSSYGGFWSVAAPVMGGSILLGSAATWCHERWFLRRALLTLGLVQSISEMTNGQHVIRYEFLDHDRERRGGIEYDLSGQEPEPLVFVLYNRRNPEKNRSARGLFFHRFALKKQGVAQR